MLRIIYSPKDRHPLQINQLIAYLILYGVSVDTLAVETNLSVFVFVLNATCTLVIKEFTIIKILVA